MHTSRHQRLQAEPIAVAAALIGGDETGCLSFASNVQLVAIVLSSAVALFTLAGFPLLLALPSLESG